MGCMVCTSCAALSLSEPTLRLVLKEGAPYCVVTWRSVTFDQLPELNGPEEDAVYSVVWQEMGGGASRSDNVTFDINRNVI